MYHGLSSSPKLESGEAGKSGGRPTRDLLFRFACCVLGHVVSRFALVAADGAHVVVTLQAPRDQELGVGHRGRRITLQLAVGFGERPETVLQAGQPLVHSWHQERSSAFGFKIPLVRVGMDTKGSNKLEDHGLVGQLGAGEAILVLHIFPQLPLKFPFLVIPQESRQWAGGFVYDSLSLIFISAQLQSPWVFLQLVQHLPLQAISPHAMCTAQDGKCKQDRCRSPTSCNWES